MVKATPDLHEDYRSFVQAHEAMIDVASYINEAKRDSELLHNINVIENSISALNMPDNTSLKDYGRLKKDGELKVQSHELGNGTKHRQRYIFLFDKLILMSKTNSNDTYKLKELLRVADYNVQEINSSKGCNIFQPVFYWWLKSWVIPVHLIDLPKYSFHNLLYHLPNVHDCHKRVSKQSESSLAWEHLHPQVWKKSC